MTRRLRLSKAAERDEFKILLYTSERYGEEQTEKYQSLLDQAKRDIRDDPTRPTSKARPELGPNIRSYHISLSRERSGVGIKEPRHLILYRIENPDEILVVRILHDSMDIERQFEDR